MELELEKETPVLETSPQPPFEITYLGNTELHDVYHVVIYPELVDNLEAQSQYKQQVTQAIRQAKSCWRNIWVAVNLGYLTTPQFVHLSYRIGLPFMREPLTIKAYGFSNIVVGDAATKSLDWLMRHTFKIEIVESREAALPPELIGTDDEHP